MGLSNQPLPLLHTQPLPTYSHPGVVVSGGWRAWGLTCVWCRYPRWPTCNPTSANLCNSYKMKAPCMTLCWWSRWVDSAHRTICVCVYVYTCVLVCVRTHITMATERSRPLWSPSAWCFSCALLLCPLGGWDGALGHLLGLSFAHCPLLQSFSLNEEGRDLFSLFQHLLQNHVIRIGDK